LQVHFLPVVVYQVKNWRCPHGMEILVEEELEVSASVLLMLSARVMCSIPALATS
jgi:hypothetical protein